MKSVKLSAGLLALSVGAVQAQGLSIGGNGRMGVQYDSSGLNTLTGTSNYRTEARLQLDFSATVRADHGLRLGAFTRARMQSQGGTATQQQTGQFSGARVFVEAEGFRLTFGNQHGAIATSGTARGVGGRVGYEGGQQHGETAGLRGVVTRFNSTGATGANTVGQQTIHARYSAGDWAAALSTERGRGWEVGARARLDAITVAAGYQSARGGTARVATASAHYDGGDWGVAVLVARIAAGAPAVNNGSISANMSLGGGDLYGYVGRTGGSSAFGVSYGYGLGGGARVVAGGERVGGRNTASVGVVFRF